MVQSAAIQVLKETSKPLHANEIATLIIEVGLWKSDANTPETTVSARLHSDIKSNGDKCAFRARSTREHGLRAQIHRGFKVSRTDSNHSNRIYPNLLHGREVTRLNEVWVTDITYVRIQTCFVYLAAIIDRLGGVEEDQYRSLFGGAEDGHRDSKAWQRLHSP